MTAAAHGLASGSLLGTRLAVLGKAPRTQWTSCWPLTCPAGRLLTQGSGQCHLHGGVGGGDVPGRSQCVPFTTEHLTSTGAETQASCPPGIVSWGQERGRVACGLWCLFHGSPRAVMTQATAAPMSVQPGTGPRPRGWRPGLWWEGRLLGGRDHNR